MKMKWNAEWKLYGVIALQDKMKWLHDKIEIEYNNYKMKNGIKNENEMEYGMKMKWSTGWKLNGLQDKNEMEHWIKWNEVHN